jgi:cytochrome P450
MNGQLVDHTSIAKGSVVCVPIMCLNHSKDLWGKDSKEFVPSQWLNGSASQQKAIEIQEHHNLLSFVDSPQTCLGKGFALTELEVHTWPLFPHIAH